MYALSLPFIFLWCFCCSLCTNASSRGYPSSMVCSAQVVNNSFAQLRFLVVLGTYWLTVVDVNLLSLLYNMLSTSSIFSMLGSNYFSMSRQLITL